MKLDDNNAFMLGMMENDPTPTFQYDYKDHRLIKSLEWSENSDVAIFSVQYRNDNQEPWNVKYYVCIRNTPDMGFWVSYPLQHVDINDVLKFLKYWKDTLPRLEIPFDEIVLSFWLL